MLKMPIDAYCVVGIMMSDIYYGNNNFGIYKYVNL